MDSDTSVNILRGQLTPDETALIEEIVASDASQATMESFFPRLDAVSPEARVALMARLEADIERHGTASKSMGRIVEAVRWIFDVNDRVAGSDSTDGMSTFGARPMKDWTDEFDEGGDDRAVAVVDDRRAELDSVIAGRVPTPKFGAQLRPGHIATLRHTVRVGIADLLDGLMRGTVAARRGNDTAALIGVLSGHAVTIVTAKPLYLSPDLCHAAMHTDVDEATLAEIKMPFESALVMLGQPFQIGQLVLPQADYDELDERFKAWSAADREIESLPARGDELESICYQHSPDLSVLAVRLSADDDGRLSDQVTWLCANMNPYAHDETGSFDITPGLLSKSLLAGLVHSIAALVAVKMPTAELWGANDSLPPGQLRKVIRTSAVKKGIDRGRYSGKVHVIDLNREDHANMRSVSTGRSVSSHWRRGHFRRVWCGPRNAAWLETRWIAPCFVEGNGEVRDVQVWSAG